MKNKLLYKVFSVVASLSLLVNSLLMPVSVLGQGVVDNTVQEEAQISTPEPTVEATPIPTEDPIFEDAVVEADISQSTESSEPEVIEEASLLPEPDIEAVQEDSSAQLTPSVSTDKADYAPTETVVINGKDFPANSELRVKVAWPDGVVRSSTGTENETDSVLTDDNGLLVFFYDLRGEGQEGEYFVEILMGATILATTTFTDGPGAVWTTDVSCGGVDLNIYKSKGDVYLNGGPHGGGGGLPDGNYYVQVTEPDGTMLGKSNTASVLVTDGQMACYQLVDIVYTNSSGFSGLGYDETTNTGREYKVWVSMNPDFPNNESKTDNFKVNSSAPLELGSIKVCKIIIDPEGSIVDGSAIPGSEFIINGFIPEPPTSAGVPVGEFGRTVFNTSLNLNANIIPGDDQRNDADCVVYGNLELGGYYYSQEIYPIGWSEPKYHDLFNEGINNLGDLLPYSGELFDADSSNDASRNTNSDGHIVLSRSRPHRTLVVLNQYEELPPELGLIQGTKYYDENSDGDHDYNNKLFTPYEDQLLNDWMIRLYDENWQLKDTTKTSTLGNKGQYRFSALPGKYFVCEVVPGNWKQTGPLLGASTVDNNHNPTPNGVAVSNQSGAGDEGSVCWEVNLSAGELDGWLKFGNVKNPVKIKAAKVVCDSEDLLPNWGNHGSTIDANTAQDYVNSHQGCYLEEQWQFQWARAGAGTSGAFQTDTSLLGGSWNTFNAGETVEIFDISNLGGRIETREVFSSNDYFPFSNGGDESAEFYCSGDVYNYDNWEWINNPQYGQTYYCVGFNALNKGSITVIKNVDTDGDGDIDIYNTPRWTWTINGRGSFQTGETKELLAGLYTIAENQIPGYHVTNVTCDGEEILSPNQSVDVQIDPGESVTCTFTNTRDTGSVSGWKWHDENDDGIWDKSEDPLGDWLIKLYKDSNGGLGELIESTNTLLTGPSLGSYSFTNIPTGKYFVCEEEQSGWKQTYPEKCHAITLEGNESLITEVNFGNIFKIFDISIEKSNDKSTGAAVNDIVTYTLVVTNNGNQPLSDITVSDALPGGFDYIALSSEVNGLSQEPTISSGLLSWNIVLLAPEDSATIIYQATIASDVDPGIYTNLATCKATIGKTPSIIERLFAILASDDEIELETIDCNIADSSVPIGVNFSYSDGLRGEVLGAATELPATGNNTKVLVLLLAMLALGGSLKAPSYLAKRKENNV